MSVLSLRCLRASGAWARVLHWENRFWELLAIKAKEMDGVTQSVYVEGKEAEIRHYGTDRIQKQ